MFAFMRPSSAVQRINPAEAVAKQRSGNLTVVDVRDITELQASGTAKGSLHVPLMLLASRADPRHPEFDKRLSTDTPVALFCASGARSQMAADMLVKLGYTQVFNIGGFGDWQRAGGAVARV